MSSLEHVTHGIEPVYDANSLILMLGTMPSPKSRETGFYYGHPQNRFWKVMAAVLREDVPETIEEKKGLLLRNRVALWDVLASCDIVGASDSSITGECANDISLILVSCPIERIFCTGSKAGQLYRKHIEPLTGMPCTVLPSTSPANAQASLTLLVEKYSEALLPFLEGPGASSRGGARSHLHA